MKSRLVDKLETLIVTVLITILVWLWAEAQNVQTYTNQRVQVRFVAPPGQAGQLAITPADPVPVEVSFTTSTGQYDRFRQDVNSHVIEIEVAAPADANGSIQEIALRNRLENAVFRNLGITLEDVSPPQQRVEVYPIETYSLRVEVVSPSGFEIVGSPTAEPAMVELRLPTNLGARAQGMVVNVQLGQQDLQTAAPNEPQTLTVPLSVPRNLESDWTTLLTTQVQVTFTVRKQTDSYVIGRAPIHINAPSLLLSQYRIDLADNQFVRDVEVSGPADVIEAIESGEAKVVAEIRPTIEELESGLTSLPVFFDLPPGVTVQSAVPQVSFTVERLTPDGTIPAP